jgi:putative ABC transport system permease protein
VSTLSLIWANLFRRRIRTLLTLLSVVVAFLLFGLLRTVTESFGSGFDVVGVDRLNVSPKYSIVDPLPISHMSTIATVPGVVAVTQMHWFGGEYQDGSTFFPKHPVDPRGWFAMYPEYRIAPEQLDAFAQTRTGCVVPKSMADKFGWKIGDKIPIVADIWPKKDGSLTWEFDLVGTYEPVAKDAPDPVEFLINYEYFDEARANGDGTVGWFVVRISDTARAAEIARAIDERFANSAFETRTATEAERARQFANQLGNIGLMMTGILGAVFFTILLLTGNTMTQALRERVPELAVLKTLGFTDRAVALLVLGEAILLTVVGAIGGLVIAIALSPGIRRAIANILPNFAISPTTLVAAAVVAVLLGLIVGAVPALTARRLRIVDALRKH